jgi:hypothetical protein
LRLGAAVLRFDEAVLRLVERLKEVLLRFANLGLQPVLRTFRACAGLRRPVRRIFLCRGSMWRSIPRPGSAFLPPVAPRFPAPETPPC